MSDPAGVQKITYIGCRTQNDDQEPKLNSFLSTMNTYGMRPHSVVRLENEYVMETGYEAAEITLQNKELPDAILCDTDILAVGVLRKLKNYGINVPEDMMLISCDDIDIASYYCPRLTTLHVPIQEISIKACLLYTSRCV